MDARANAAATAVVNVRAVSASALLTALDSAETTVDARPAVAAEPRPPDMHNPHHYQF